MDTLTVRGYVVLEQVYSSNGCTVYKGRHPGCPMCTVEVAIKVQVFTYAAGFERAKREIVNQTSLQKHPNVVQLFESFDEQQPDNSTKLFLVMEWVTKDLMKDISQRRENNFPWSEAELKSVSIDLVRVLAQAQRLGICHRDIKPQNIFYETATKQVKLGDFGSSAAGILSGVQDATLTGTPAFMTKEMREAMAISELRISHDVVKSDVFALGVTILSLAKLEIPIGMVMYPTEEGVKQEVWGVPYSEEMKWFIGDMVTLDVERRLTFVELEQKYQWGGRAVEEFRSVKVGGASTVPDQMFSSLRQNPTLVPYPAPPQESLPQVYSPGVDPVQPVLGYESSVQSEGGSQWTDPSQQFQFQGGQQYLSSSQGAYPGQDYYQMSAPQPISGQYSQWEEQKQQYSIPLRSQAVNQPPQQGQHSPQMPPMQHPQFPQSPMQQPQFPQPPMQQPRFLQPPMQQPQFLQPPVQPPQPYQQESFNHQPPFQQPPHPISSYSNPEKQYRDRKETFKNRCPLCGIYSLTIATNVAVRVSCYKCGKVVFCGKEHFIGYVEQVTNGYTTETVNCPICFHPFQHSEIEDGFGGPKNMKKAKKEHAKKGVRCQTCKVNQARYALDCGHIHCKGCTETIRESFHGRCTHCNELTSKYEEIQKATKWRGTLEFFGWNSQLK